MSYTPSYTPKWQDDRNQLNHVWFQNRVHGILNGHYSKQTLEKAGYSEAIRNQWQARMDKVRELISSLEKEMSPANLFDHMNHLCNASEENKKWMRELIHKEWIKKYRIHDLQKNAQNALDELVAAFPEFDVAVEVDRVTQADVEAFASKCRALSDAIHNFPNKVWI